MNESKIVNMFLIISINYSLIQLLNANYAHNSKALHFFFVFYHINKLVTHISIGIHFSINIILYTDLIHSISI